MADKFKPGQRVRAIDESHNWDCIKKGDIGVVHHRDAEGIYHVDFPHRASYWKGEERCFEDAEPKPPKLYKFDMKRALNGEPVITRNGVKVNWVKEREDMCDPWVIEAEIEGHNPREPFFRENGSFAMTDGVQHHYDLFMAKPARKPKPAEETKPAETTQRETTEMAATKPTAKATAVTVANKNKAAAVNAAKITAGKIAIKQIQKVITPKLPMMARGYADTPVGRLVTANIFNFVVAQYMPGNAKAQIVADAVLEGAMFDAVDSLKIEEQVSKIIEGIDISKFADLGATDAE